MESKLRIVWTGSHLTTRVEVVSVEDGVETVRLITVEIIDAHIDCSHGSNVVLTVPAYAVDLSIEVPLDAAGLAKLETSKLVAPPGETAEQELDRVRGLCLVDVTP